MRCVCVVRSDKGGQSASSGLADDQESCLLDPTIDFELMNTLRLLFVQRYALRQKRDASF